MKKNLFIILAIFSFVSCNILQETEIYFEKPARIVVSAGEAENARTVFAEPVSLDSLQFVLEGECGEDKLNKTWASYSAMKNDDAIFLQPGKWKFSLKVQDANEDVFYTSELEQQIVNGDNPLHFELIETSGTGGVEVTLSFADGSGVAKVSAVIKNISDKSEVTGTSQTLTPVNNSVTYTKTDIQSGNYILQFDFYNDLNQQIFLGVMEIIQIKKGRTSKKVMPKIEEFETADFDYGVFAVTSGTDISKFIKTVPENMPASSFTWKTDKDNVSVNDDGEIVVTGAISEYPLVVEVTATPKNNGGKPVACTVVIDDDLSLTRAELQEVCASKGIDYETMTEFEVPYGYTELADEGWSSGVFRDHSNIEKVTLPETLEKIGQCSFRSCTSLKTVKCAGLEDGVLPKKLTAIGTQAFFACISLEKITIPGGVETIGNLTGYDSGVFHSCVGLKEIIIEDGVKTIGKYAFKGDYYDSSAGVTRYNTSITKISIPKSVENIGEEAFENLQNPAGFTVTFTDSGDKNADAMTIGNYAFQNAKGLKSINLPDNLTAIGAYAFYSCDRLAKIIIPGSVKSIGDPAKTQGAFEGCSGLEEIIIEDGVEEIGYGAFQCYSDNNVITQISIPKSVKTIGKFAFRYMKNPDGFTVTFTDSGEKNADAMTIGDNAFVSSNGLKSINLPDNVISIGKYAFNGCSNLSGEIKIPEGATTIGEYAFQWCSNIQEVSLPSTLTSLGQGAFQYCDAIETIIIANGIKELPSYAFQNNKITSIVIPESVTKIGQSVFDNCASLAEVKILSTANNIDIGNNAFTYISNGVAVYFYATTPPTISGAFRSSDSPTFYVPSTAVDTYKSSWTDYASNINPMPSQP